MTCDKSVGVNLRSSGWLPLRDTAGLPDGRPVRLLRPDGRETFGYHVAATAEWFFYDEVGRELLRAQPNQLRGWRRTA